MSKYKFRLSYKENDNLVPINLDKILVNNATDIKTIDEFTTRYEDLSDLLNNLKEKELIPNNINYLYITFDSLENGIIKQQLYAFNKTIFYKKDINKLNALYASNLIRKHIQDGSFMQNIIGYYKRKYIHKNFNTIDGVSYNMKNYGFHGLTPNEYSEYESAVEYFITFIFYKKDNKGKKEPNYRNIRDFICYLYGETPIKTKKSSTITVTKDENEERIQENLEESTLTYKEYCDFNKTSLENYEEEDFEPYRDGNDWIAPIKKKEIISSLNNYAKKLCLKKDNKEYE